MISKHAVLCLAAAYASLRAQPANDPAGYPSRTLEPVILAWEPNGAEYKLHTRELDSRPFPPHRIIANVYYVGSSGYASYLVTSDQGHILIDTGYKSFIPTIRANVEKLGFRFNDIKILLLTHAHVDHTEGAALVKELTGAKLQVMEGDAEIVESGGPPEAAGSMPPAKVDRVLHDKDQVTLGENSLTAHLTPGHTPGSTTWLFRVMEGGKEYTVNMMTSLSVNDARFLVSPNHPTLVEQYLRTYRVLKALPCDVFLSSHDKFFGLHEKYAKMQKGGGTNPYIDPEGYRAHIALQEANFYYKLDWANRWLQIPR
ncbi:MAG: subclass B3 metallo-beta-lactamase [Bryobacteraceae bacterium]